MATAEPPNTKHVSWAGQSDPLTHRKIAASAEKEIDLILDEENHILRESDFKKKQVFKGWTGLWLAYQATGVIYGDIGTSPLYVFSSTFSEEPSYDDLLGAVSLIIWSLTLIVTVKYALIVLYADDEGEGGTFAIYSLLSRYSDITKRDPKSQNTLKMERYDTADLKPTNKGARDLMERSRFIRGLLKTLAVLGVSLVLADSILTPAQSVLGAIQGLKVVDPDISTSVIVGVSCAILILLFLLQPLGISKLGSAFAPIVILWLLFNLGFGIYNLIEYDHSVLKGFSPFFAGNFLMRNKYDGWVSLGGILLCFTGVEALFADLGAFSRRAVQLSWLCFAYPCLLFAYIGQAAFISHNKDAFSNPFFNSVPSPMFYPSLVLSILAAIVASQALITSAFQLLSQVMNTSYFPQIKMIYTSEKFHGQVYIPLANWLIMIGTVVVTAVYNNTTKLGHAYGVCVILVTFITTCLVSLVALVVWKLNWVLVLAVWLPFITLDGLFLSSSLTKLPDGAWFTVLLAFILSSIFILWRYGKEQQWSSEGNHRSVFDQVIAFDTDGKAKLADRLGGGDLTTIKGLGIFFDKAGDMIPTVYEEFLRKFEAHQNVNVFLHLRALSRPHVSKDEQFAISRTSVPNCYRLIIRHGYNDHPVSSDLGTLVYQEVRKAILRAAAERSSASSLNPSISRRSEAVADASSNNFVSDHAMRENEAFDTAITKRIAALDAAYGTQTVYIVGKEQLRLLKSKNNIFKRCVLGAFLWLRENTRAKIAKMEIPVEKLVEVGFVREI